MHHAPGRRHSAVAALLACLLLGVGEGWATDLAPDAALPAPLAFVGVDVVPMNADTVLRNQTVVVRDGRIEAIGPADEVLVPPEVAVVEGTLRVARG